jgi:hypothetical protein
VPRVVESGGRADAGHLEWGGAFQPVRVPVEAVERILTNLVKNAAEATPWVGTISIHVEGVLEQSENHGDEARRR